MDEQARKSLGKQLRNSRLQKELTMEGIAKALHTSKQNIDRYEKGNYKKPDYNLLAKLADLLEIDLQNFGFKTIAFDKMLKDKTSKNTWVEEKIAFMQKVIDTQESLIEQLKKK